MPNPEQLVCEILGELEDLLYEMETSERREMEDMQRTGRDSNSHGAGVCVGVLETVQKIREWMSRPRQ